jgi:hypothetical protein
MARLYDENLTCFTTTLLSIAMSSSFVILDISLTAHSVSKLNFWNISSCKLFKQSYELVKSFKKRHHQILL